MRTYESEMLLLCGRGANQKSCFERLRYSLRRSAEHRDDGRQAHRDGEMNCVCARRERYSVCDARRRTEPRSFDVMSQYRDLFFVFFIVLNLFANRSMNQFPTACHLSHTSRASRKEKTGNRLRILFDDKRRRKILKFISRRVRLRFSTEKKLNSSSTKHTIRH